MNPLQSIIGSLGNMGNMGNGNIMNMISQFMGGNPNKMQEVMQFANQFKGKNNSQLQDYLINDIRSKGGMTQEDFNNFKAKMKNIGVSDNMLGQVDAMFKNNPDLIKK